VLADIHAADKASPEKVSSSAIVSIIRKAALRRVRFVTSFLVTLLTQVTKDNAAQQFLKASRQDLAGKEQREVVILSNFMPPSLSEDETDRILRDIVRELSIAGSISGNVLGKVSKEFYSRVDKSTVDPVFVTKRARALLSSFSNAR
jgi:uncharacterized protein YqeY